MEIALLLLFCMTACGRNEETDKGTLVYLEDKIEQSGQVHLHSLSL